MSTVVRSLAAKVEVQTREAEQNLDRFRAKLRTTDVALRGASAYQNAGVSPLSSAGAVARQAAAVRAIQVQEMFWAQQARMSVGSIGSRMFGGSGIPVTSSEIDGLTLRGGGSMGSGALGEMIGAGAAGQAGGVLSKVKGLGKFSALLRGAGPVAAAVVTVRQAIQTTSDVIENMENVTDDNSSAWKNQGMVMMDALSHFTMMKGPMDAVAKSIVNLTDYGAKYTAGVDELTASLAAQADEKMKRRKERDEGSAAMGEHFMGVLAGAEIELLAEKAEQTQRFADMQAVASSAAERYDLRVNELRMSLMAGAISQDAFNESLKAANEAYDDQSGIVKEISERNALYMAGLEDKARAEQAAKSLADQVAKDEADRARIMGRAANGEVNLSRTFIGSGASAGKKQEVNDPQLKEVIRVLRSMSQNTGIARAA